MGLFRSALKFVTSLAKTRRGVPKGFSGMVASPTKAVGGFSSKRQALHKAARNVAASPDKGHIFGMTGLPSIGRATTHGIVMATKSNRNAALAPVVGIAGAGALYALAKSGDDDGWGW